MKINPKTPPVNNAGIMALQMNQQKTNEISKEIIKLSIQLKTQSNKEKILGKLIDIIG